MGSKPEAATLLQSTDKEALPRRTGATECLGLIAEALGRDLMGPLVPGIMEAAFQVGAGLEVCEGLHEQCLRSRLVGPSCRGQGFVGY